MRKTIILLMAVSIMLTSCGKSARLSNSDKEADNKTPTIGKYKESIESIWKRGFKNGFAFGEASIMFSLDDYRTANQITEDDAPLFLAKLLDSTEGDKDVEDMASEAYRKTQSKGK